MERILMCAYRFFYVMIPTLFYCRLSGLPFKKTWNITGRPVVIRRKWYEKCIKKHTGGIIEIGDGFTCNNKVNSNSIGLIQPCVFNISIDGSEIKIGNNVGISGSTINAATSITIEDNVIIGSGCLITDTDSHPLKYEDRLSNNMGQTKVSPVLIKEGAFIGARSIIMKGVTVGRHSIIGAGSVVTMSVPDNVVVCGNPAIIIRETN